MHWHGSWGPQESVSWKTWSDQNSNVHEDQIWRIWETWRQALLTPGINMRPILPLCLDMIQLEDMYIWNYYVSHTHLNEICLTLKKSEWLSFETDNQYLISLVVWTHVQW